MASPHQSSGPSSLLKIRPATVSDIGDLTRIAQAAFPDDPEWDYRFPYRDTYPEDNYTWTRREYEGYLAQPNKYAVLVATLPEGPGKDSFPVALAVWDIAPTADDQGIDTGVNERRDADWKHMQQFADTLDAASTKYFSHYHDKQYHLWLLATHPEFRRRGAATALTRWGLEAAADKAWPVTVLASPMGQQLYEHLGFSLLANVVVKVEGEDQMLVVGCLECKAKKAGWLCRLM